MAWQAEEVDGVWGDRLLSDLFGVRGPGEVGDPIRFVVKGGMVFSIAYATAIMSHRYFVCIELILPIPSW